MLFFDIYQNIFHIIKQLTYKLYQDEDVLEKIIHKLAKKSLHGFKIECQTAKRENVFYHIKINISGLISPFLQHIHYYYFTLHILDK
jgi:hypothetical protein